MCEACSAQALSRHAMMFAGAALSTVWPLGRLARAQPVSAANTPDAALNLLIEGNARYAANQPRERDFSAGRSAQRRSPPYSPARTPAPFRKARSAWPRASCS